MKTDDLIALLAKEAGPAPRALARRRLLPAIALGWLAALAGALMLIGPQPAAFFATIAPWIKLTYAGALLAATASWTARLGKPGLPTTWQPRLALIVLFAMALAGGAAWFGAAEPQTALLGKSWPACLRNIPLFALPAFAGIVWAMRGLAPTRLRLCGFAAGIAAGAAGALAYAFACSETSPAFVAIWYSAGIALCGTAGAVVGPKFLRW